MTPAQPHAPGHEHQRPAGPEDIGDGLAAQARQAQEYAALCLRERDELLRAVLDLRDQLPHLPEQQAIGSRDFGRGYALACTDLQALLDQLLQETA